jgi:hypothetical protein
MSQSFFVRIPSFFASPCLSPTMCVFLSAVFAYLCLNPRYRCPHCCLSLSLTLPSLLLFLSLSSISCSFPVYYCTSLRPFYRVLSLSLSYVSPFFLSVCLSRYALHCPVSLSFIPPLFLSSLSQILSSFPESASLRSHIFMYVLDFPADVRNKIYLYITRFKSLYPPHFLLISLSFRSIRYLTLNESSNQRLCP